jgi:hypothetical protein
MVTVKAGDSDDPITFELDDLRWAR